MNPIVAATPASVIRALHGKRRPTSINLGLGEPTLMPDVAHFERATAWVAEHGCRYSSNIGDHDLRTAIAHHYGYPGLDKPENVCITTGSQEAVYVALRTLLDPAKDEIVVAEPAFNVYTKIANISGVAVKPVPIDPRGADPFDPDAILAAVGPKTRMIVIASPSNPTGRVISKASTKRIADALLARGGPPIYVLHDEIYRELKYTEDIGEFGKVYPYTIAVNSLSKSNALTGLRLGWLIAPADVMPELVKFHGWATSCASTFGQRIAYEIFANDELHVQRRWYTDQCAGALDIVRASGLEHIVPDGAFYICLNVGATDTMAFAEKLLEDHDIVAIPGHIFSPIMTGWVRTSFVASLDDYREGVSRIKRASEALAVR